MVPICDHKNNTIPADRMGSALQIATRVGSSSFAMLEISTCSASYMVGAATFTVSRRNGVRHGGCGVAAADGVVDIRVSV